MDQPSTSSQPKKKQKSRRKQGKEAETAHAETGEEEHFNTPSNDPLPSEMAKSDQAIEIASLKKREDASKQGSIEDIDADVEVTLVNEQHNEDLMFDTGVLDDDEVFVDVASSEKNEQSTKLDDSTAGEVTTAKIDELTLAQTLIEIKAVKPKVVNTTSITTTITRPKGKGVVVQEPSEFRVLQDSQPSISKDKGKGIMVELEVPLKRKDQIALDEQIARDIQAKLDAELEEEHKLARKHEEEANIALIESWENTQAMMEADRLLTERLQSKEREELTDEEKRKLFMQLMEKRRKHFVALKAQEKRNRPPTKAQKRTQMSTYLKHMGGYTYKQLKGKSFDEIQKLFDKEMKRVNTFVAMGSEVQESKEKKEEGREETTKGSRKKMLGRKRAGKQQQQESIIIIALLHQPLSTQNGGIVSIRLYQYYEQKFYKKIGKKLQFDAKEPVGMRRDAWNSGNKDGRRSDCSVETHESDAPIIEEYELDSKDEHVSQPTKEQEQPIDKKGLGYGFTARACFVCGSLSHLIRDCDFHEKRMAKQAELNNSMKKKSSQREIRPIWNNVQLVNHKNQFVPTAVLTRTGKIPVNTARASGTNNVSIARHNFNRQTILTNDARKISTVKPVVNRVKPKIVFHKTHSPFTRPFINTTALRTNFSYQKVNTVEDYLHRALQHKGIVDSGCSRHMTGNKAYLVEYQDFNGGPVAFGGKLQHFNLFFVSQICDKKNKVLFTDSECLVLSPEFKLPDENQVLLRIPRQNNMYSFNLENIVPSGGLACLIAKATIDESNKWHRRLGHVNFKNLNKLVKGNLVRGLPSKIFQNDHTCVACQKGKQHKASCKAKSVSSISHSLQLLHMDLFGPTSVRSLNHKTYCLVITDDFSRFSWVFFLRTKDETSGILKDFIRQIENQLNQKVKTIRCDNGTEFKNRDFIEFCGSKGIKREYSNARTPQQNGVAERKNRTLIEAARTMLADSFLPNTFWAEAVSTACYVLNRVLVTKPHNKTPYELVTGKIPIISYIRPFGCHVTILNTIDHLGKFDGKSDEGFLVGYSLQSKAFRVYNLETKRVEENLHITFLENKPNVLRKGPTWLFDLDYLTNTMNYQPVRSENQANKHAGPQEANHNAVKRSSTPNKHPNLKIDEKLLDKEDQVFLDELARLKRQEKDANDAAEALRKDTNSPYDGVSFTDPTNPDQDNSEIPTLEDIYKNPTDFTNLETVVNVSLIPTSRINYFHPSTLILGDLQSAVQTRNLPYGKKAIGTKWVYRNKKDERGVVVKNKVRIEAIRIFLAFASYMGFIVYQIDVKSTFLYGKIDEEVYVSQPPGFIDPKYPQMVYKVVKALYGLHQAPRAWYATLSTFLLKNGYRRGTIDKILFIKKDKHDIILVQVYVDDIIFGSTKKSWYDEFEALMKSIFQMSSIGELTFFLRLQVKQKEDGIFISQDKYVAEILKKFDFVSVKTASTPIKTQKSLVKDVEANDVDVHLYRSMIGSLMYLTASRPDIMFALCACSRFQVTPKTSYLIAVKRIFRYLKGKPKLGLWYPRVSLFDLEAYSGSDYARANLDRKSTTGGCQFLDRRLISWQCKKQTIMATSTIEAEYVAAANYCGQVLWIQN
ncbi:putative ribonuclease H-like domain-containing protein [Tanacetum coccineum]